MLKWVYKKQNNYKIYNVAFFFKKRKTSGYIITLHLCTKNLNDMIYSSWDIEHEIGNFRSFFTALPKKKNPKKQNFEKMKKITGDIITTHEYQKSQSYDLRFVDTDWGQTEFFVILGQFLLFTPSMIPKNKILKKMKKVPWNIIILHMCTINEDHMIFLRYKVRQTEFFVILDHFLLFHCPPDNLENQNFEKLEKTPGGIIILHMCTINGNHIMNVSWRYGVWQTEFFVILDGFLPFYPPNTDYQNFEKMKKMPGAIITLIMCTINDKHIMYGFRDKQCKRQFFVTLGYFLPFYPTNNLQNQN